MLRADQMSPVRLVQFVIYAVMGPGGVAACPRFGGLQRARRRDRASGPELLRTQTTVGQDPETTLPCPPSQAHCL